MGFADHEIRAREIHQIIDFFERAGVPDIERISFSMHHLVVQEESAAESLFERTGAPPLTNCSCHVLCRRVHIMAST